MSSAILRKLRDARREFLRCEALARTPLAELVDDYIDAALWQTQGNVRQAALLLGVDRGTLYRRGKQHAAAAQRKESQ